jgi:hypothetical protein
VKFSWLLCHAKCGRVLSCIVCPLNIT